MTQTIALGSNGQTFHLQDWKKVQDFLEHHQFDRDDVNAPRFFFFNLMKSYPLHQAAKERNWPIMTLLIKFGADWKQRDSWGKKAFDYVTIYHGKLRAETF